MKILISILSDSPVSVFPPRLLSPFFLSFPAVFQPAWLWPPPRWRWSSWPELTHLNLDQQIQRLLPRPRPCPLPQQVEREQLCPRLCWYHLMVSPLSQSALLRLSRMLRGWRIFPKKTPTDILNFGWISIIKNCVPLPPPIYSPLYLWCCCYCCCCWVTCSMRACCWVCCSRCLQRMWGLSCFHREIWQGWRLLWEWKRWPERRQYGMVKKGKSTLNGWNVLVTMYVWHRYYSYLGFPCGGLSFDLCGSLPACLGGDPAGRASRVIVYPGLAIRASTPVQTAIGNWKIQDMWWIISVFK